MLGTPHWVGELVGRSDQDLDGLDYLCYFAAVQMQNKLNI